MKKLLTNNIGLKILSLLAAVALWIVVVNIDDPIIYNTFSGIPVEITNTDAITKEGKTYEIQEGYTTVTVTVQAERSVIESMSKDNIKATADMKNITLAGMVPIEVRATRNSDRIKSITPRTSTIPVKIENKVSKQMRLLVNMTGDVSDGYVVANVNPSVSVITISGPESVVNTIKTASITVDVESMNDSFKTSCEVEIRDNNDNLIESNNLEISKKEITADVEILETKEIPVTAGYSGTPSMGYSATGMVICDPASVIIAGKGAAFDNLTSISIPASDIDISGATGNSSTEINIKSYLPKDIILAGESSAGDINVVTLVEAHKTIEIPVSVENISVENLPHGYIAHVVSGDDVLMFDITGLESDLNALVATQTFTAVIDAMALTPRTIDDGQEGPVYVGANDGMVILNLPANIIQNTQKSLEVLISNIGDEN